MAKPSNGVLTAGIAAPPAAALLGLFAYQGLTRASADPEQDFVYRLTLVSLVMTLPFVLTVALAAAEWRRGGLTRPVKAGLGIGALSLVLLWLPLNGVVDRWQQARNLSLSGVPAPSFDTQDISGNRQRLADHSGKVVLVNIWATWCAPCKEEMANLDRLYHRRKQDGLMVFGFSTEDIALQRKFLKEKVTVSYPLLTGDVPSFYRDIARFPAIILIDRAGHLQPAPGPDQSFEAVEAAVTALLQQKL